MEPVEQVFLRVSTTHGFRTAEITTATDLVRVSDMTEIVGWFTDAEDNSVIRFDTLNIFFHPLPSGDYAIGVIYPDQRGFFSFLQPPKSFYIRILVVPPRTLLVKGNNPPALYEELRRRRKIPLVSRAPKRLAPIQPLNIPLLSDDELLTALADSPGPEAMAAVSQALFETECSFLYSPKRPILSILSGLFELLPISFRTELTFSTDLFFSVQNPFRIIGLAGPRRQVLGQAQALGIPLMVVENNEKAGTPMSPRPLSAWPRFVAEVFRQRRFDFLKQQWKHEYDQALSTFDEESPRMVDWEHLNHLADSWRSDSLSGLPDLSETHDKKSDAPLETLENVEKLLPMIDAENRRSTFSETVKTKPAIVMAERLPHLRNEIRHFDTLLARLVFDDSRLLPEVRSTWHDLCIRTTGEERELLCEEYLGRIRSILISNSGQDTPRPERSATLLQLMSILLENERK